EVLGAAVAEITADALFAQAIVDRRIDVVDAAVEDSTQDAFGVLVVEFAAARRSTELHGAKAELSYLESGAAEGASRQIGHRSLKTSAGQHPCGDAVRRSRAEPRADHGDDIEPLTACRQHSQRRARPQQALDA